MNSLSSSKTSSSLLWKLFFVMVLEYFVLATWFPLIYMYLPGLELSTGEQCLILNAFPVAAIVGLFVSNQISDRNVSPENVLAMSHLLGGIAIFGCGFVSSFWPFFVLILLHCLCYVPTLAIVNSIAFANMDDPQRQYGLVRMGGTFGWLLAAWFLTFLLADWVQVRAELPSDFSQWLLAVRSNGLAGRAFFDAMPTVFIAAGVASCILAGLCMTLPKTFGSKLTSKEERIAWLKAVFQLKKPYLLLLWTVAMIDAFVESCFIHWSSGVQGATREVGGFLVPNNWTSPVMNVGTIAEILSLFLLAGTLKLLGWRWTMCVGLLGNAIRFLVYACSPDNPWLIVTGQIFHGLLHPFFYASLYIFVDSHFPKDIRSSGQGLFNFAMLGVGVLTANGLCPLLHEMFTRVDRTIDYQRLFFVPAICAGVAAITMAILFRPPKLL